MNNLARKLFFSAVKLEFRSFQFYRRLQRVLFYTKLFVSCILDLLLYDLTQRAEINNKQWRTASSITDFANKQVNFLPTEWMTTCFEQRCHF